MQIPILIEPADGNGFRAATGGPLALEAEAPTREEAMNRLRERIAERVQAGAAIVSIEVAQEGHPLAPFAGMLKDDPLLEDWKVAMEEYRDQVDFEQIAGLRIENWAD